MMKKNEDEKVLTHISLNGEVLSQKRNLKILVVEDNSMSFTLTATMIQRLTGVFPDRAVNGQEAVECAKDTSYDLIFMDQYMPVMNGSEASERINALSSTDKKPMLVGLSGATHPADIKRFHRSGIDQFLAKPLRLQKLKEVLISCSVSSPLALKTA